MGELNCSRYINPKRSGMVSTKKLNPDRRLCTNLVGSCERREIKTEKRGKERKGIS